MNHLLTAPETAAQRLRDALLGVLIGLARATCAMPCGNTADYDLTRLWNAPAALRTLKLRLLDALLTLAEQRPDADAQYVIYQGLFTLAEDWDESLLLPVVQRAEELCRK